jgi:hypothetical protein
MNFSFLMSVLLVCVAGVFYMAGHGQAFQSACNLSRDLCSNPQWALYAAGAFIAAGFVFNIGN